jgi:hypothetical protein
MKHTPGPWYTRHGQISSEHSSHGCTIANCNATSKGIGDEEVEANAILIAAAPEMLACLELAIEEVEGFEQRTGIKQLVPWVRQAREAVAKAKGE